MIKVYIMIGSVVRSVAGRGSMRKDVKEKVSVVGSWGQGCSTEVSDLCG